jgi:hypothetical protein
VRDDEPQLKLTVPPERLRDKSTPVAKLDRAKTLPAATVGYTHASIVHAFAHMFVVKEEDAALP